MGAYVNIEGSIYEIMYPMFKSFINDEKTKKRILDVLGKIIESSKIIEKINIINNKENIFSLRKYNLENVKTDI
jgi:hypothetical protein